MINKFDKRKNILLSLNSLSIKNLIKIADFIYYKYADSKDPFEQETHRVNNKPEISEEESEAQADSKFFQSQNFENKKIKELLINFESEFPHPSIICCNEKEDFYWSEIMHSLYNLENYSTKIDPNSNISEKIYNRILQITAWIKDNVDEKKQTCTNDIGQFYSETIKDIHSIEDDISAEIRKQRKNEEVRMQEQIDKQEKEIAKRKFPGLWNFLKSNTDFKNYLSGIIHRFKTKNLSFRVTLECTQSTFKKANVSLIFSEVKTSDKNSLNEEIQKALNQGAFVYARIINNNYDNILRNVEEQIQGRKESIILKPEHIEYLIPKYNWEKNLADYSFEEKRKFIIFNKEDCKKEEVQKQILSGNLTTDQKSQLYNMMQNN